MLLVFQHSTVGTNSRRVAYRRAGLYGRAHPLCNTIHSVFNSLRILLINRAFKNKKTSIIQQDPPDKFEPFEGEYCEKIDHTSGTATATSTPLPRR